MIKNQCNLVNLLKAIKKSNRMTPTISNRIPTHTKISDDKEPVQPGEFVKIYWKNWPNKSESTWKTGRVMKKSNFADRGTHDIAYEPTRDGSKWVSENLERTGDNREHVHTGIPHVFIDQGKFRVRFYPIQLLQCNKFRIRGLVSKQFRRRCEHATYDRRNANTFFDREVVTGIT
eukprot:TRINITY_DN5322_c0_g5_i2.p1 TRINITY_DN5322_c0_g5~~TRINITY_DN5322_c0_g5_i2.p1  ORF type:complete len:175 (-),score=3.82 TRINITY_DN5322_c0_g5_i2:124-648(-)